MAQQTKVFAPEGYHFMVKKDKSFYLMKGIYTAHTLTNGDKSSQYVMISYLTAHPAEKITSTPSRAARTAGPTVRTTNRTVTNTASRATTATRTTSSGSSSGGSSGGGGY